MDEFTVSVHKPVFFYNPENPGLEKAFCTLI